MYIYIFYIYIYILLFYLYIYMYIYLFIYVCILYICILLNHNIEYIMLKHFWNTLRKARHLAGFGVPTPQLAGWQSLRISFGTGSHLLRNSFATLSPLYRKSKLTQLNRDSGATSKSRCGTISKNSTVETLPQDIPTRYPDPGISETS